MSPKEKQATPKMAFVFPGPLTNESPALAGSGARMCGIREYDITHIKNYKNVKSGELTHFLTKTAYEKIKIELREIKDSGH